MNDSHIPVPLKHRPNVVSMQSGQVGMTVQEEENEEVWMYCDTTVEVEQ
jgi:hypothetical protein